MMELGDDRKEDRRKQHKRNTEYKWKELFFYCTRGRRVKNVCPDADL